MNLKSVALYGFSDITRHGIMTTKADEIWSLNNAHHYGVPRIDRLFEMHQLWNLHAPGDMMEAHWQWLQQPHDFPIYMLAPLPEVPASVPYPLDFVVDEVFGDVPPYITSSVGFMLALAIAEKFERIELYGIDMSSDTEYSYQRHNTEYLIGFARGREIEVVIPSASPLCKASGLYGYDGGFQVISRQTMERIKSDYKNQLQLAEADFEQKRGKYDLLRQMAQDETDEARREDLAIQAQRAYTEFHNAKNRVLAVDAGVQVCQHFLDTIDLKEDGHEIRNCIAMSVDNG